MSAKNVLSVEELFCLEGCSTYEQYCHMRGNFERGESEEDSCAFCNPDRNVNDVLEEDEHMMGWQVNPGFTIKKGILLQLLVVPKRHIRYAWDMNDEEALSCHHVTKRLVERFQVLGGGTLARFGPMHMNAGTVPHWHNNIMVPDISGTQEVRLPLFKNPKDREANVKRAAAFSRHYENGMTLEEYESLHGVAEK